MPLHLYTQSHIYLHNVALSQTISCRAAVAWSEKQPLTIETVEVAPPRAHEVRIRVIATGVCHTDAYTLGGHDSEGVFPVVLGHEGAGIVESIGEGVTKFAVGDHVIPLYIPQCYECDFCRSPKTNICQKIRVTQGRGVMPDGTTRFRCRGQDLFHFMGTSTFAEYTVVADISLAKVDATAPLDKVCLLGCGISTGFGAALNTAGVEAGATCAVWGLGAVGLATIMGCRAAGASKIVGIDINPDKFEIGELALYQALNSPSNSPESSLYGTLEGDYIYYSTMFCNCPIAFKPMRLNALFSNV